MAGTTQGGQKTAQGGRGNPDKASPSAVEHYIKGIHFPCDKNALIQQAQGNNAPDDVMSVLNRFEEKQYTSAVDIAKEVGQVE